MPKHGTITRKELKAKMDRGDDLVLLEILPEMAYRRGHLPGAVWAPNQEAAMEAAPDKATFVVTYCSNKP